MILFYEIVLGVLFILGVACAAIWAILKIYFFINHIRRDRIWHRNPKVDDFCYFNNSMGTWTTCQVKKIDGTELLLEHVGMGSKSSGWHDIEDCHYLSEDDMKNIADVRWRRAISGIFGR